MDSVDNRERHGVRGPTPHHEASSLTGHVSQQLRSPPAPSSLSPSQHFSPPSPPSELLPDHPFNFSFPTLNLDGSLPDLDTQPLRRYPPTPPAALSSLGAKSRMVNRNDAYSESELTDGQYDMIDDLSEISTDDHDTASITSQGDDGQLTPEDAGSELDPDEPRHVVESYTSEDLETPRQSTLPIEKGFRQFDDRQLLSTTVRAETKPKEIETASRNTVDVSPKINDAQKPLWSLRAHVWHTGARDLGWVRVVSILAVAALFPLWVTLQPSLAGPATQVALRHTPYTNVSASQSYSTATTINNTLNTKPVPTVPATISNNNNNTQLASYVSRDLQVLGKTAVSFLEKAVKAGNQTALTLSKDLVVVRQDVARFSKDLSTFVMFKVAEAKNTSRAIIREPLAASRDRLQSLKKVLSHRKDVAMSSIQKELSEMRAHVLKGNRNISKHTAQENAIKAMSAVSDPYPKMISSLKTKRELKKAIQQFEALSRMIEKRQDKDGKKLSMIELYRLKKETRKQEKVVKRLKAEIERSA